MHILERLLQAHIAVIRDTANGGRLGFEIGELAIKAVTEGIGTPEWKAYMSLFADNLQQLSRLTDRTDVANDYFPKGRAYIVANGTCGAETDTFTLKGVESKIQDLPQPLPSNIDGNIVDFPGPANPPANMVIRPLKIPPI